MLGSQQVDLWVRMGGTPSPHIHSTTYISQDQAGPWCTQLQILDLPVLELNPLNFHLFFDFPPAKMVLSTRSSESPEIYPIKNIFFFKWYESVNFCLWRAWPEIHRPWTCSRPHTYMHHSKPQYDLLWPYKEHVWSQFT